MRKIELGKLHGVPCNGLEVRPKSGVEAKIVSRRERKEPNAKSYPLIRRAFGDAAIVDGWRFGADVHFSAGPLARIALALLLSAVVIAPASAQPETANGEQQIEDNPPAHSREEIEMRARAMAARRAERDAGRAERLPSRPIVLRGPIPLPVAQSVPLGGVAAGKSCPATESCVVEYTVTPGRTLVVTALWSATDIQCDQAALGAAPPAGQVIAPWWHCTKSLKLTGKGAGFSGYLFTPPASE